MNQRRALAAVAALVFSLSGFSAAMTGVSISAYRRQLHEFSEKIHSLEDHPDDAGSIIASIPDQVSIDTTGREITVSYHPLKDALTQFSKADSQHKAEYLKHIHTYLATLEEQAEIYEQPNAVRASSSRQKLAEILARREFRNVHRPGFKESLLAKIYRWLSRLFGKIHFGSSSAFSILQVIVYALVGAALLILVLWTVNRLRRQEEELPPREIIPFSPSARSWRAWLADARTHADKQDWRNAIHLAYWAGISFLESGGAWKPNRARTPREYLRLLTTRNPNHRPLSALTSKFEVVWYGDRPAAPQDFQDTLGQLEKMGCR